jgi:hypothetical protein
MRPWALCSLLIGALACDIDVGFSPHKRHTIDIEGTHRGRWSIRMVPDSLVSPGDFLVTVYGDTVQRTIGGSYSGTTEYVCPGTFTVGEYSQGRQSVFLGRITMEANEHPACQDLDVRVFVQMTLDRGSMHNMWRFTAIRRVEALGFPPKVVEWNAGADLTGCTFAAPWLEDAGQLLGWSTSLRFQGGYDCSERHVPEGGYWIRGMFYDEPG